MQLSIKATTLATALFFSTSLVSAHAQTSVPTDKSIAKLIEVTQVSQVITDMLNPQNNSVEPIIQAQLEQTGILDDLTPEQQQQLQKITTDYTNKILTKITPDLIKLTEKSFIQTAKKHYTQAEVDAQIKFYGSPVGKSIITKQPKVMNELLNMSMPQIIEIQNKEWTAILPEMQEEIVKVLKDN